MSDQTCLFCGDEDPEHSAEECRPDLFEHEIGEECTWHHRREMGVDGPYCYAYQDRDTKEWGSEHIHFYPREERKSRKSENNDV